jgi:hypothetical protein
MWEWLKDEKNQKALALIGATLAAVVTAGWQFYVHEQGAGGKVASPPAAASSAPAASAPGSSTSPPSATPTVTRPSRNQQSVQFGDVSGNANVNVIQSQ